MDGQKDKQMDVKIDKPTERPISGGMNRICSSAIFFILYYSLLFLDVHDVGINLLRKTISSPTSSRLKRTDAGEAEQDDWQ